MEEEIRYTLAYQDIVVRKDIPRLSPDIARRIKEAILVKLTTDPLSFSKPLQYDLFGYRGLRVGDYRVLFRIAKRTIFIDRIVHRSEAYR